MEEKKYIAQERLKQYTVYHMLKQRFKEIVHPQKENSIVNYLPSCHSKLVRHLQNKDILDKIRELSDAAYTATQLPCSRPRKLVRISLK